MRYSPVGTNPPTQKATVFETVDECVGGGTLRSLYERSRVMLRRVPPYEACGGAAGFSPWGLHRNRAGPMVQGRDVGENIIADTSACP